MRNFLEKRLLGLQQQSAVQHPWVSQLTISTFSALPNQKRNLSSSYKLVALLFLILY